MSAAKARPNWSRRRRNIARCSASAPGGRWRFTATPMTTGTKATIRPTTTATTTTTAIRPGTAATGRVPGGAPMLADFLVRAALAGTGTALAAGPLGCFVIWRRMAYFGDATAHAAILGVALSLALSLPVAAGTLAVALVMAATVSGL